MQSKQSVYFRRLKTDIDCLQCTFWLEKEFITYAIGKEGVVGTVVVIMKIFCKNENVELLKIRFKMADRL